MTAPQHAVVSRLSADFAAMSEQFAKVSAGLTELDRILAERPPQQMPQPAAYPVPTDARPAAIHSARRGIRAATSAMARSTACRPAAAVLPTACGAEGAPTPARRKLDRQGSRSRRCCGHAHRSRAAARARCAGGHSPSRNPCRRRGVARRRARRRRDPAERSARRTGRRHRAGRHRVSPRPTWTSSPSRPSTAGCPHPSAW